MLIDGLLLLGLIMISGALALSEIAIVGSRRTRLVEMIDNGSSGAARALDLASQPTRFLSSVQLGITSIGILSGAIGDATIAGHVRPVLERVPVVAAHAEPMSLAIVVVMVTYVSLIIGELVPKRLAMTDPDKTAALISGPMQVLATITRPIVYVLSASTSTVLSLLRVPKVQRAAMTVGEIKVLLEQSTSEGVLEPGEREMMTNVLNLDERQVGSVLTPRSDVVFLDVRDAADVNRRQMRQQSHEIIPVCDDGLDHVLGVVRARRVLEEVLDGHTVDLSKMMEVALFVPETMTVNRRFWAHVPMTPRCCPRLKTNRFLRLNSSNSFNSEVGIAGRNGQDTIDTVTIHVDNFEPRCNVNVQRAADQYGLQERLNLRRFGIG